MQRSKQEAEVIVRLDFMDQQAHICVSQWPAMAAKMRKRYGPSRDAGSDKAYGELSSATKESQKALAREIKEELAAQFPEIAGLNAKEAKLQRTGYRWRRRNDSQLASAVQPPSTASA
jgi:hypothetical protein